MREQKKRKLIGKLDKISDEISGNSMYLRPFQKDEQIINEIARTTGEKKSAVAQKLIHLALAGKVFNFSNEKKEMAKLDWLINNEKHKRIQSDVADARLERLEEHAGEMEKLLKLHTKNSHFAQILQSEIYCMNVVCVSYLNQIFTKLIEYFSPVEIERKNSSDFAHRNALGLIEHSLSEMEKIIEHHGFETELIEPEMLYLFTKIEKIKARLFSMANKPVSD